MTIGRLLGKSAEFLAQKGMESPRLETEVLLAHVLGCKRIDLYGLRHGEVASDDVRQRFRELIRRRLEGCPVAYLVGRKEFFSLEFEVTPAVLIPQPDTECLVLETLRLARGLSEPHLLDLGTGSGNIAVSVAHQHKGARFTAVDLSAEALAVAARNAARHGVAGRIRFLHGDLFDPLRADESFDFVLSNPPYVAHEELAGLDREVRDHEPRLALDGGPGGFAVFDRLIDHARGHLKPAGHLLVEIGSAQERAARDRIAALPGYDLDKTVLDRAGRPRVLHAVWRGWEVSQPASPTEIAKEARPG
jgi:release factor glutamine methyltransferase